MFSGSPPNSILGHSLFASDPNPYVSVAKAFDITLQRLELDQSRVEKASGHYNAIKNLIGQKIPDASVKRIGSFKRHTKIRPANIQAVPTVEDNWQGIYTPIDIDAIACLGNFYAFVQPSSLVTGITARASLDKIYSALCSNGNYRLHEVTIESPIVKLDYASEFSMEIVPCYRDFITESSKNRLIQSYWVPGNNGNWKSADYDFDAAVITKINEHCEGKLIPAIKLLKGFVRSRALLFKSFHVEVFCALSFLEIADQFNKSNISWSLPRLFVYLLNKLAQDYNKSLSLPGSLSEFQRLSISDATQMVETLPIYARAATNIESSGDTYEAVKNWRLLYGHPFPPPEAVK